MKNRKTTVWGILLAALLAFSLAACSSASSGEEPKEGDSDAVSVTNAGLTLSIPAEYSDLLAVDTPQDSEDGTLFSVSEKASIEAGKAQGMSDDDGAGWLFSIGRISEEDLHEMLCNDMSGMQVFAKDEDGNYYMFYHPTDVRLIRENNEEMEQAMESWSALNEWAWTVPETFVAENDGLTAETRGNTELDIYLARIAYLDDTDYTIGTTEYGPLSSDSVDAAPYLELLMNGATYERVDGEEAPDGEYVVLSFPEDDVRFDFFLAEGKENYIRQVWAEDNESLYKAVFADESIQASSVMQDWYNELAAATDTDASAAGQGPDEMVGTWAEKIAGRGNIEIKKGAQEGRYDVQINWGSSAFETAVWTMTASSSGNDGVLTYDDGKMSVITFSEDGTESEEVKYENGTGSFYLNDKHQLVWQDDVDHSGDDTVFIKAD